MQIDSYNEVYQSYFHNPDLKKKLRQTLEVIIPNSSLFFIGNGGSNSICSHMMEDYAKIGGFKTYSFSDAALITCFANDYGYENAMREWLKIFFEPKDVLIAISSSGNSMNISNAVSYAKEIGGKVISLSGFDIENKINGMGDVNFHIPAKNYGIVECFHQVILHTILDEIHANK